MMNTPHRRGAQTFETYTSHLKLPDNRRMN